MSFFANGISPALSSTTTVHPSPSRRSDLAKEWHIPLEELERMLAHLKAAPHTLSYTDYLRIFSDDSVPDAVTHGIYRLPRTGCAANMSAATSWRSSASIDEMYSDNLVCTKVRLFDRLRARAAAGSPLSRHRIQRRAASALNPWATDFVPASARAPAPPVIAPRAKKYPAPEIRDIITTKVRTLTEAQRAAEGFGDEIPLVSTVPCLLVRTAKKSVDVVIKDPKTGTTIFRA